MKSIIKIMAVSGLVLLASTVALSQTKEKKANTGGWGGFYIGGNLGLNAANNSMVTSTEFCGGFGVNDCYFAQSSVDLVNKAGKKEAKGSGFTGGLQVGYLFQKNKLVAGIEADYNIAKQNETVSSRETYTNITPGYQFELKQTIKSDWLMTIRPKIGYATGKAFIYATGGLAFTSINYQMNFEDFPNPFQSKSTFSNAVKQTKTGWTAGAGAEFKVSNNWSVKGEYLYTQFNTTGTTNNGSYSIYQFLGYTPLEIRILYQIRFLPAM